MVAAIVAALAATVVASPPASAADGTGSISGIATYQDGSVVAGGAIRLISRDDSRLNQTAAVTGTDFLFAGLPAGAYMVCVDAPTRTKCWQDNAEDIVLAAGESRTGIDVVLPIPPPPPPQPGSVAGTVLTDDGDPIVGDVVLRVGVAAHAYVTLVNGAYRFDEVPPGDYRVCPPEAACRDVTVVSGDTTTADFVVAKFDLSGRIHNSAGEPVTAGSVRLEVRVGSGDWTLYDVSGAEYAWVSLAGRWDWRVCVASPPTGYQPGCSPVITSRSGADVSHDLVLADQPGISGRVTASDGGVVTGHVGNAVIGPDGSWSRPRLGSGTYTICARVDLPYYDKCLETPVVVGDESVTGIDIEVGLAGTITGSIDPEFLDLDYFDIWAYNANDNTYHHGSVDGAGGGSVEYAVTGLAPGSYVVCLYFQDGEDASGEVLHEGYSCWENATVRQDATPVQIAEGEVFDEVDLHYVAPPAWIASGVVEIAQDSSGVNHVTVTFPAAPEGATLETLRAFRDGGFSAGRTFTCVDVEGVLTCTAALPPLCIETNDDPEACGDSPQWRLHAPGGFSYCCIEASWSDYQQEFGTIDGRAVDIEGNPVAGVTVTLGAETQVTGVTGTFSFHVTADQFHSIDLVHGSWMKTLEGIVHNDNDGGGSELYDDGEWLPNGDVVVPAIVAPELFDLVGTVTDEVGNPIDGIEVSVDLLGDVAAQLVGPRVAATTTTNQAGEYLLAGVAAGTYRLTFADPQGRYRSWSTEVTLGGNVVQDAVLAFAEPASEIPEERVESPAIAAGQLPDTGGPSPTVPLAGWILILAGLGGVARGRRVQASTPPD